MKGPYLTGCPIALPSALAALDFHIDFRYHICVMSFPIRTCVICGDEFELKPDKPGFANRCPSCSEPEEATEPETHPATDYADRRAELEVNAARRKAMRDLLYRKDA